MTLWLDNGSLLPVRPDYYWMIETLLSTDLSIFDWAYFLSIFYKNWEP